MGFSISFLKINDPKSSSKKSGARPKTVRLRPEVSALIGVGFALGGLVFGLVSCTSKTNRSAGGSTLTIAVNAGVEGEALKKAAQEWGASKSIKVNIVELPYANLFEKELLDLKSKTGAYDVVMMDDPWFPQFVLGEQLTSLDEMYLKNGKPGPDSDFIKSTLDVCRQPWATGKYFALPYVGNSQLFFYRKDLFEKHQLPAPATWTDVLAGAKSIGASEKMYGYVMRAAAGNAVVADFMPVLWAFGADMFSKDGKPTLESPEAIAALKFMIQLGEVTPPGYTGFNADEVSAHLLQSSAVMSINWPAWIAAMDDSTKSKVVGKVGFAQIPSEKIKGQPELGAWLLAIPRGSRNTTQAFEFITWATDPEQMRVAAERGNPPTRDSVFNNPDLIKKFRAYPVQKASLANARPRPRSPVWNEIENAFGIFLSKANSKSMTPEEAMKAANTEIQAILNRTH